VTAQPLSDERLAEIAARAEAATPGPWTVDLEQCDCSDGWCGHGTYVSSVYSGGVLRTEFSDFPDADWQFVIRARTDVPALLAEIQRLGEQVARLEDDRVRYLDQQAKDDAEFSQVLAERDRYRSAWQSARERAQAYGEGILRVVKDRESYQQWLKQEQAVTQQLRTELAEGSEVQHYDKVPDPLDGCHWCACGNRWPCRDAGQAVSR
jgi:hypothetical protein